MRIIAPQHIHACLIDFSDVKDDFKAWLRSRDLSSMYIHRLLRYLNRFPCRIKGPMGVVRLFSDLTLGQKHNLQKAWRACCCWLKPQEKTTTTSIQGICSGFEMWHLTFLKYNVSLMG